MASSVSFHSEDIKYTLQAKTVVANWIKRSILKEGKKLKHLNFIFCSDEYLRLLNIQYLNHPTYTDIITFDSSDIEDSIEGDIFISIPRVRENAEKLNIPFEDELHRVLIHGVLHLMGYTDKTPSQKKEMRNKEDAYLSLR